MFKAFFLLNLFYKPEFSIYTYSETTESVNFNYNVQVLAFIKFYIKRSVHSQNFFLQFIFKFILISYPEYIHWILHPLSKLSNPGDLSSHWWHIARNRRLLLVFHIQLETQFGCITIHDNLKYD